MDRFAWEIKYKEESQKIGDDFAFSIQYTFVFFCFTHCIPLILAFWFFIIMRLFVQQWCLWSYADIVFRSSMDKWRHQKKNNRQIKYYQFKKGCRLNCSERTNSSTKKKRIRIYNAIAPILFIICCFIFRKTWLFSIKNFSSLNFSCNDRQSLITFRNEENIKVRKCYYYIILDDRG